MARESGRNMALYIGLTSTGAPAKVPYMSEYSIDASTDKIEVTAGGDSNKTYVTGLPDFSATISGFADNALNSATDPLWVAAQDGQSRHFRLYPNENAASAAVAATVSNKALTSNVATLTTSAAHGFTVGMFVTVAGVDATFNGTYLVTDAPTTTTFRYAKTATDVVSAPATGTATGPNTSPHFFGQAFFDRSEGAGVASARTISSTITAAANIYRTP